MRVLVDASVWIDHIRSSLAPLSRLLACDLVLAHPMVIGEVALGSLADRPLVIASLKRLPPAIEADHDEVMTLIENYRLFGSGIGYVDVHLIAACILTPDAVLWTRDKRLRGAVDGLGLAYALPD